MSTETPPSGVPQRLSPESALGRVLLTLGLIIIAVALTTAMNGVTGDHTAIFYLSAAVLATWAWGIGPGALVVIAGSVMTMHSPADPPTEWQWSESEAWARVSLFATITLIFAVLIDRARSRERELAHTVDKLQAVLDLAPVGIAIADDADLTSSPVHVNETLASMFNGSTRAVNVAPEDAGQIAYRSQGKLVASYEIPMHQAMSARSTSSPLHLDFVRDGRTAHVIAQAAPLLEAGNVRGAVATYVDVTEAYEREQQLTRANQAKDEFLGIVSHELNTPLTIIAGNVEILTRRMENPGEPIERVLTDLRDATDDLLHDVQDLLLLARGGDTILDLEPVSLCEVIQHIVESHRDLGHSINAQCTDAVALGVPYRVQQVITNLVTNAEKYSPPGAPIEISAASYGEDVKVTVSDRGSGLNEDELETIFLPFYRSTRTSAAADGMGIGLSVCKHLVGAMGGRIWASQRDGGGTEFGFTLMNVGPHDDNVEPQTAARVGTSESRG